jgi:hypothetical protein
MPIGCPRSGSQSKLYSPKYTSTFLPKATYDNNERLFVASQSNSVWSKVASCILEPWRIVPQELAERIPQHQWKTLGIHSISPQNLIQSLKPSTLRGQDFTPEERQEILTQVSINGNGDLWRSLALHTAANESIVSVTNNTYRSNPDFEIPIQLGSLVSIISETSRPEWIPLWTSRAAITLVLSQPQPEQYCDLLLKLITQVNGLKSDNELLKHLREVTWLQLNTGERVSPKNVILLPPQLDSFMPRLEEAFQSEGDCVYVTYSMLASQLANLQTLRHICETWYGNNILEFLLGRDQRYSVKDPSIYACFILNLLDVLGELEQKNQGLRNNLIQPLRETAWRVHPSLARLNLGQSSKALIWQGLTFGH